MLVVAKVNGQVASKKTSDLKETIYDNLVTGANIRKDLQIIEVMVCSSNKQYENNTDIEVFMDVDPTGDNAFYYEGIIKGSVKAEGFVVTNLDIFNVEEYVCKIIYRTSLGSDHRV